MDEAQIRNEDCRLDVLNALHARRTGAHQADTIRTVFLRQRDYTLKEVETALSDLERRHHAEHQQAGARAQPAGPARQQVQRRRHHLRSNIQVHVALALIRRSAIPAPP